MKTLVKLITICLLTILSLCELKANPRVFTPLVRNWSTAEQDAGRQNWSIAQDGDGVMYIGNNSCLLEFDGFTWRPHYLPDHTIVRCVACGPDGRIYVGSYREFGWYDKRKDGSLQYHSISKNCRAEDLNEDDIWRIVFRDGKVYFQSFEKVFVYDGSDIVETIVIKPLFLFDVDGVFYTQIIEGGFHYMDDNGKLHGIALPKGTSHIVAALPYGDGRIMLVSSNSGLFLYDRNSGAVERFRTDADNLLVGGDLNRALRTDEGEFVIGSASKGIFALDGEGSLLWKLNNSNGLQNETVLGMVSDRDGNIWLALDDGVSMIMNSSPFGSYQPSGQTMGMVYDLLYDNHSLLVATNKGLFRLDEDKLEICDGVIGQTWYIERFDDDILVGNNSATYRYDNGSFKKISSETGAICATNIYWKDNSRHILEGSYIGICNFEQDARTGHWEPKCYIPETALAKNLEMDASYHVWHSHNNKGISRLTLSDDLSRVTEVKYFPELADSVKGRVSLFKINGRIAFTDGDTFFTYDDLTSSVVLYDVLNEVAGDVKGVHNATRGRGTTFWMTGDRETVQIDCSESSYRILRRIPFSLFGVKSEDRSSVVYDQDRDLTFLCLNDRIISIEETAEAGSCPALQVFEIEVSDKTGKRYSVGLPESVKTKRGYNNVTFRLRYPEYGGYGYCLQYRLKGLSSDWISLEPEQRLLSFERLRAKRYDFQVRVMSMDRQILDEGVEISVKVRAPWYFSRLAVLCYLFVLAGTGIIIGRHTKQRTIEIITLKDSVDEVRHAKDEIESQLKKKENELSSMLMGGMATDARKWDLFKSNFERVEEHFFSTLTERYPDLTSSDLKFCALLRLNMSTKEIADALNLTTRGVESARYRLRKKFRLGPNDSLTSFILNIK